MKRHLTKSVYILACSAGVFFGCANVFARESAILKLPKRGGNGASQRERGGSGKREEKITSAQSKHGLSDWTLQNIIYSSGKKRFGTSSILAWRKSGVSFSTASKSCPEASVEIALTFLLRNTRDIPSRSNSKRLASTAGVKIRVYVRLFWIQNNSFKQFRANENEIINIDLQLIGRHQSTSPMPHHSGALFAIVRSFPKEQWYRAGVFFSPLSLPTFLLSPSPHPKGYYFSSSQSSSVIKSKMAATTIRTWTSFRPPKIRLHCRILIFIIKSLHFRKTKMFSYLIPNYSYLLPNYYSLWIASLFGERVKKSQGERRERVRACRQTSEAVVPRHLLCITSWCKLLLATALTVDRFDLHRFFRSARSTRFDLNNRL